MKATIHQSQFLPYPGYFSYFLYVDNFIFLDTLQYVHYSWQNRNVFRSNKESVRVTVPVKGVLKEKKLISELEISYDNNWDRKFFKTLKHNYRKCSFYDEIMEDIMPIFNKKEKLLNNLNISLIKKIKEKLEIKCNIINYNKIINMEKNERILEICKELNVTELYIGTGTRSYINLELMKENNIQLFLVEYKNRPYPQQKKPFIDGLSILDMLFNIGYKATKQEIINNTKITPIKCANSL